MVLLTGLLVAVVLVLALVLLIMVEVVDLLLHLMLVLVKEIITLLQVMLVDGDYLVVVLVEVEDKVIMNSVVDQVVLV